MSDKKMHYENVSNRQNCFSPMQESSDIQRSSRHQAACGHGINEHEPGNRKQW